MMESMTAAFDFTNATISTALAAGMVTTTATRAAQTVRSMRE
jgi:hypothetical protein